MTINLDELERLAREATPGPWEVDRNVVTGPLISPWLHSFGCRVDGPADSDVDINATATYIAACSPDVVLGLVERVRELEEVVEKCGSVRASLLSKCGNLARSGREQDLRAAKAYGSAADELTDALGEAR